MASNRIMLRKWTGRTKTADEAEYAAYVAKTGAEDSGRTPGNLDGRLRVRKG